MELFNGYEVVLRFRAYAPSNYVVLRYVRELIYRIKGHAPLYHVLGLERPKELKKMTERLQKWIEARKPQWAEATGGLAPGDVFREERRRMEGIRGDVANLVDLLEAPVHKSNWDVVRGRFEAHPEREEIIRAVRELERLAKKNRVNRRKLAWLYQKLKEVIS